MNDTLEYSTQQADTYRLSTSTEKNSVEKSVFELFSKANLKQTNNAFYEVDAQFHTEFINDFCKNLILKHQLPIYDNGVHSSNDTGSALNAATNVDHQPAFQKLLDIYYKHGFVRLCEELSSPSLLKSQHEVPKPVKLAADVILNVFDFFNAPINPWFNLNKEKYAELATIKDQTWKMSKVKCLQWHPNCNKYAVVFKNDSIQVYSHQYTNMTLKHPKQIQVKCIAWKPFYPSILAVGCVNCIIIWDTEVIPVSIKPSSSCTYTLSKRYHKNIVDLQWYPKSDYLLSISADDNQILSGHWDIAQQLV